MKVLIAEDDMVSRRLLQATLCKWGYEAVVTSDGAAAWEVLPGPLIHRHWPFSTGSTPGLDGLQVCHKVREVSTATPPYLILLTAKGRRQDIVTGLQAGANDYVTKPFDREELRARLQARVRIGGGQQSLADRVIALEEALTPVKQLQGHLLIVPIVKKSVMIGTTGSRSKATLLNTRRHNSATASVRTATTGCEAGA